MTTSTREIQRRLRATAGYLVEDSSLRDQLTDEQGQQLINWGLAQVKAAAQKTASLPEAEAMPILEEKTTAVRLVMLAINYLIRLMAKTDEETAALIDEQLVRLLKNLTWLTGQPVGLSHLKYIGAFKQHRHQMDSAKAFELFMELIQLSREANTSPAASTDNAADSAGDTGADG